MNSSVCITGRPRGHHQLQSFRQRDEPAIAPHVGAPALRVIRPDELVPQADSRMSCSAQGFDASQLSGPVSSLQPSTEPCRSARQARDRTQTAFDPRPLQVIRAGEARNSAADNGRPKPPFLCVHVLNL